MVTGAPEDDLEKLAKDALKKIMSNPSLNDAVALDAAKFVIENDID